VDLELNEEQQAIVDLFTSIAQRGASSEQVRAHEPLGFSAELWRLLADAGAPGMALSEAAGGGGAGLLEVALVIEALGRRVAPAPLVEPEVEHRGQRAAAAWIHQRGQRGRRNGGLAEAGLSGRGRLRLRDRAAFYLLHRSSA